MLLDEGVLLRSGSAAVAVEHLDSMCEAVLSQRTKLLIVPQQRGLVLPDYLAEYRFPETDHLLYAQVDDSAIRYELESSATIAMFARLNALHGAALNREQSLEVLQLARQGRLQPPGSITG